MKEMWHCAEGWFMVMGLVMFIVVYAVLLRLFRGKKTDDLLEYFLSDDNSHYYYPSPKQ